MPKQPFLLLISVAIVLGTVSSPLLAQHLKNANACQTQSEDDRLEVSDLAGRTVLLADEALP